MLDLKSTRLVAGVSVNLLLKLPLTPARYLVKSGKFPKLSMVIDISLISV